MKEVNKKAIKWWNYELTTDEREEYLKRAGKGLEMVDIDFVMESYTKEHKEMKKECSCKAASKSPKPIKSKPMKELSSFDKKYKEKNAVMLYIESNFGEEALSCFSERRIYDNLENYVKRVKEDDFDFFYSELRKESENNC